MKTFDPFDTGANALEVSVQVPAREAAAAAAFLANDASGSRAAEADAGDEADPVAREAHEVAQRIRFAFLAQLMFLCVPLPWLFARRYFQLVARLPAPPPDHRRTAVVLGASLVVFALMLAVWPVWLFPSAFGL